MADDGWSRAVTRREECVASVMWLAGDGGHSSSSSSLRGRLDNSNRNTSHQITIHNVGDNRAGDGDGVGRQKTRLVNLCEC